MSMQPPERVAELIDEAYAEMKQRYDAGSHSPVSIDAADELVVIDTTDEFSAFVSWPTPGPSETLTHIRDLGVAAAHPRGVCYDGAFRGKHRNALMKRGLVVVTPRHPGATARAHHLVKDCPCGRAHDLWTKDGAVCLRTINIEGGEVIEPLEIAKVERRERAKTHSWYLLLRLPWGEQRQTLIMLGFAMGQNSRERWFREAEKAPPAAA